MQNLLKEIEKGFCKYLGKYNNSSYNATFLEKSLQKPPQRADVLERHIVTHIYYTPRKKINENVIS